MNVRTLLRQLVEMGGSDLYLYVGSPPIVRAAGELQRLDEPKITPVTVKQAVYDVLKPRQREALETELKLDYAYGVAGVSRFRVSLSMHRGTIAAQFRSIPVEPPTLEQLGAPATVRELCQRRSGLIVISGPAGCGKTSTMAAMINEINSNRECTINTIEDPIEYLHPHRRAAIGQQEVGMDTRSYLAALQQLHRQHPEVLMLGSTADSSVLSEAIIMAEMGQLVLIPVRARGAIDTLRKLSDFFPERERPQAAHQIAVNLSAIVSQVLIPSQEGKERVAGFEILLSTPKVRECIRSSHFDRILQVMESGEMGMCTLEQSLRQLADRGLIDYDTAVELAGFARPGSTPGF